MRAATPRFALLVTCAVALGMVFATTLASARVAVLTYAGTTYCKYFWKCGTDATLSETYVIPDLVLPFDCAPVVTKVCPDGSTILMNGCWDGFSATSYAFPTGNVRGGFRSGDEGPSAVGDPEARDSVKVGVTRGATNVQLSLFPGRLRIKPGANSGVGNKVAMGRIQIAVYPDSTTANADRNDDGRGAVFFTQADIFEGGTIGKHLSTRGSAGGLSSSNFVLTTNPDGSTNAAIQAGALATVTVPSGPNAAIKVVVDPAGSAGNALQSLPGVTPIGLGLLALLMLGSGLWFVRGRRLGQIG